jgi:hypothetical protein
MTRTGSLLRVGFWIALNLIAFAGIAPAAEDEIVYHLIADRSNVDLNDKMLAHPPDDTIGNGWLKPLFFHPVMGHFRILTFRGSHEVLSSDEPRHFTGHYVIVLKVDDHQHILDGYFYMMEWTDDPWACLMRLHAKSRHLAGTTTLSPSDFRPVQGHDRSQDLGTYFFPTAHLEMR